ncbi:MAG: hypothetical protein PHH84_03745 [Oscillospiraceae bacterium]|nr:hypothetical protein [Oscillospiraceae bacterium]
MKQYPRYVVIPNHFHAIVVVERADMESAENGRIWNPPLRFVVVFEADLCVSPFFL